MRLRNKAYAQLEPSAYRGKGLSASNLFLLLITLAAVTSAILSTEATIVEQYPGLFQPLEIGFGLIFLSEYVLRIWVAPEREGPGSDAAKRWHFVKSPSAIFDAIVIVACLAPFVATEASILRIFRLARVLMLAKLGKLSVAIQYLTVALADRRYELLVTVFLAGFLLLFGASALYWVEGDVQPDKFGSIPRALWWSIITLTTVGYGDVSPITPLGKIFASIVAVAGIGLVAMPAGIMAAAFSDAMQKQQK